MSRSCGDAAFCAARYQPTASPLEMSQMSANVIEPRDISTPYCINDLRSIIIKCQNVIDNKRGANVLALLSDGMTVTILTAVCVNTQNQRDILTFNAKSLAL
jgi:hypothetical protein